MEVTELLVKRLLRGLDTQKATNPDNFRPHLLNHCAKELAISLTIVFPACLVENTWQSAWKNALVVLVQKRNSKFDIQNYWPILLLSMVGKMFEKVVAHLFCRHLKDNYLLSD